MDRRCFPTYQIVEMRMNLDAYRIASEPFYQPVGDEIAVFEAAFAERLPLMLKGPTGCGKTRFVEHMAWRLEKPLVTVAAHEDMTASDLAGRYLLEPNGTVWHDGPLTLAVRFGAICYLDEIVEAKNNADALIHTTERTLNESGDKVPQGDRDAVQQAMQALKDTLSSEDAGQIKAKTEALAQVSMKLGEALYRAQQTEQAGSGEAGPSQGGPSHGAAGGSDKVVDADFEEVDDQKKRGSA